MLRAPRTISSELSTPHSLGTLARLLRSDSQQQLSLSRRLHSSLALTSQPRRITFFCSPSAWESGSSSSAIAQFSRICFAERGGSKRRGLARMMGNFLCFSTWHQLVLLKRGTVFQRAFESTTNLEYSGLVTISVHVTLVTPSVLISCTSPLWLTAYGLSVRWLHSSLEVRPWIPFWPFLPSVS